jgi:hypothetical protein
MLITYHECNNKYYNVQINNNSENLDTISKISFNDSNPNNIAQIEISYNVSNSVKFKL